MAPPNPAEPRRDPTHGEPSRPRVVLAGGNGFLGGVLAAHFANLTYEVVILTRSPDPKAQDARHVAWDGVRDGEWAGELDGARALINLAGVSVNCRYHARNRRRILDSRLEPTRALANAVARCRRPPRVWLNASTATIYRHHFGPPWDESGSIGGCAAAKDEFSVRVATDWERAFFSSVAPQTRKVALRSAMVLGRAGNSVLPALVRLAKLGLGGSLAGGRQFTSWIHQEDFCRAVVWLIDHDHVEGVVNLAAPHPVTNAEFMRTVREACGVRLGLPAARWMLELGAFFIRTETELIIKSRCVGPGRLLAEGFAFRYPELRPAVEALVHECHCQSPSGSASTRPLPK